MDEIKKVIILNNELISYFLKQICAGQGCQYGERCIAQFQLTTIFPERRKICCGEFWPYYERGIHIDAQIMQNPNRLLVIF